MNARILTSLALVSALALPAVPAAAQQVFGLRQQAAQGWIGFSFDVRSTWSASGMSHTVVVDDVIEGSPAEQAGLDAGDILVAVNELDEPDELRNLTRLLRLSPGDPVRIVYERDGRRHEVRVRAVARPEAVPYVAPRVSFSMEADSVAQSIFVAMDSLRRRLVLRPDSMVNTVAVLAPPMSDDWFRSRVHIVTRGGSGEDSLRREIQEISDELRRVRVTRDRRVRELTRSGTVTRVSSDSEVARLTAAVEELSVRVLELEAALEEAAAVGYRADVSQPRAWARAPAPTEHKFEFRPLTPYVVGQNYVAGAQVIDLKPELGRYFDVEAGVLVVEVPPGTPAAVAGLRPGDVIVRLGREAIGTVQQLRSVISRAGGEVPVTVVREGSRVQVRLGG